MTRCRLVRHAVLALVLTTCAATVTAQVIHKCKGADGRISYASAPCATGATQEFARPVAGPPERVPTPPRAAAGANGEAVGEAVYRASLPKVCDNQASLQFVVTRLDSPSTPDDIRDFLAAERFRLLRCEYTRFTSDERRARDAAMRDLVAREAARRRQAVARMEALYDRYLTPQERAARARSR